MIILLIWVVVLITVVALYFRQVYSTFSRHGIKHIKPIPGFGNMGKLIFRKDHFIYDICNLYNRFPEERFVGRYEFVNAMILLRDVELVKKITVQDFDTFVDHRSFGVDSFSGRTLIMLKGQEWKDMRSTLSPAFTSSKIRVMVPFMVEVGDQMIRTLEEKINASGDGYIEVDCIDLTTRYSTDVIASCAFGLKVDSLSEPNNQFYVTAKNASHLSLRQMLIFFLLLNIPKLFKVIKWDIVTGAVKTFFTNLVRDTMKDREMRHIIRPDMIHILMETKKGKLSHENVKSNDEAAGFATVEESSLGKKEITREWKDSDLVAQAFLFFVAGFETISSSMAFLLYELAVNPDVQDRLVQELREHDAKNNGKFDINSIQSMTYLDMVVSEVLRRWPPGIATDRVCNKDYNLGKPNDAAEKDYIVPKGSAVIIPIFAFHHDPKFFPEPEKFDPERFSKENKHKINPLAFMPFGLGPRNCIASRFALCEVKLMAYQLLRHMELSPCKKTCIPAKLATDTFSLKLHGGHWVRFRLRKL